ncbi:MAG: hypothetical protein A3Q59_04140 [Methanomethylophilus alvi]|nr:MAG: hypothetical protein A3Q59_04140 [Methanomethylophilus alvi]
MKRRKEHIEEDPAGLKGAVRDFNSYCGPARIFYNRNSKTFFVRTYPFGGDKWWGDMCNGLDIVELYRKTSCYPDITVTEEELRMMELEIGPYSAW